MDKIHTEEYVFSENYRNRIDRLRTLGYELQYAVDTTDSDPIPVRNNINDLLSLFSNSLHAVLLHRIGSTDNSEHFSIWTRNPNICEISASEDYKPENDSIVQAILSACHIATIGK